MCYNPCPAKDDFVRTKNRSQVLNLLWKCRTATIHFDRLE